MTLRTALTAATVALALAVAACGDDDDDGGTEESAAPTALSIVANDDGIQAPASAEAGLVEITLENAGKDDHEAQLIGLEGDHTAKEVLEVLTGDGSQIPDWFVGGGGVGTAEPGQTLTATQVLAPGRYAIIDTGAKKPQSAELEVTGEPVEAELPQTDATVTASEYTFETSGLKPGSNTFLFENAGQELHHVLTSPVKEGATAAQVKKFLETDGEGADPFTKGERGDDETAVLDAGESQVADLDLEAGSYAFMCFIPDRAGGPPHALKGMITIEEIR